HRRERLEPTRRLQLVAHRAGRLPIRTDRRIDPPPLVQHPGHQQLLGPQPALLGHHLPPPPHQPFRRPAPQLLETTSRIEHAPIKTRGYDTYRPYHADFDRFTADPQSCCIAASCGVFPGYQSNPAPPDAPYEPSSANGYPTWESLVGWSR